MKDISVRRGVVRVSLGSEVLDARAAVLALGWGPPRVDLPAPGAVRRALQVGTKAFDFSRALSLLARKRLRQDVLALVGSGPSALSFLEACVGLGPSSGLGLTASQRLLWFEGTSARPAAGLLRMFRARYGALERRLRDFPAVERIGSRVEEARQIAGRWRLVDGKQVRRADALVWCGGFEAPLGLISAHSQSLRPYVLDGVKLALQRVQAEGAVPIFQVGPSLDQLGLSDWDTGPFAEWFEKGRRLLQVLK